MAQRGQIFQRHNAWHVRYRVDGKQVCTRLADFNDKYRTARSVRPLADEIPMIGFPNWASIL